MKDNKVIEFIEEAEDILIAIILCMTILGGISIIANGCIKAKELDKDIKAYEYEIEYFRAHPLEN